MPEWFQPFIAVFPSSTVTSRENLLRLCTIPAHRKLFRDVNRNAGAQSLDGLVHVVTELQGQFVLP